MPLWTNRYNGLGIETDVGTGIVVDDTGKVFVTGYSAGFGSFDYLTLAYSNDGVPLWTNLYNAPANQDDFGQTVAVDTNGLVFVTGYSEGPGSAYAFDYATLAFSSRSPVWTNYYDGPAHVDDYAEAMVVDNTGTVFVTGCSSSSTLSGSSDYATVAYCNGGVPLWTNRYNGLGNGDDIAKAIAVDGNGNVIVTGYSRGTNGYYDYATVSYSNGGFPLWTNRYDGPGKGDDYAQAIAVDSSDNIFVTGYSRGTNNNFDYATVAYMTSGLPLWTNRYNGPGKADDFARAVVVDSSGDIFITGYSARTNAYPYNYDYATISYSTAGVGLWTNRYNGPGNGDDFASAIGIDSGGNVFVTGSTTDSNGGSDYATLAYSATGVPLWTNIYHGPWVGFIDVASALAVDRRGNVFVTGHSTGTGGYYDCATVKYSSSLVANLTIQRIGNEVVLNWTNTGYYLQTAFTLSDSFTNIASAASPYTTSITGSQQYFRLISP